MNALQVARHSDAWNAWKRAAWQVPLSALKSLAFQPVLMLNALPRSRSGTFTQLLCAFYKAFDWEMVFLTSCYEVRSVI